MSLGHLRPFVCKALLGLLATCAIGACGSLPGDSTTAQQLLVLVNQARAQGRVCGDTTYAPTGPLRLDTRLTQAAQHHSQDMFDMQNMSHTGSDGSNPGQRIARTGYQARGWGENVAGGYGSVEAVMNGWLGSPGHCRNIMNPSFEDFGAGEVGRYWTQKFARPR